MTSLPRPSSLFPLFPSPWRPSSLRPPCLHAVFSPSALNSSAFNIIRGACGDFVPSPLLRSTHLQSLMGTALWRRKPTEYSDWNIVSRDGGTLALVEQAMAPETDSDEAPVLVVLPGLTGTKDSKYITNLVVQAAQAGFRAIVVNWRGFTTPLTSAIVSTAMDTSDAVTVLTKVKEKYPCAKGIFAVGFSAGANYLIKALGEHQNELGSIVTGAVAVSNPFDYVSLSQKYVCFLV